MFYCHLVQTREPLPAHTGPWSYWSAEYCSYIYLFPVLESQGSAVHEELCVRGGSALTSFQSICAGGMTWKNWNRESAQF